MKRKSLFALSSVIAVAAVAAAAALWSGGNTLGSHGAEAAAPADQSELIKRGEYLARAGDCIACHTVRGGKTFAGGLPMLTPFGTMFTPNITPDDQYGIGKWTADDFYRSIHTGRSKDGSLLYPAMPFTAYTKVTRADSDAMFAYMRSVPPVHEESRPHEMRFPFNQRNLLIGWRVLFFREGEFKPDPTKSVEWNRGAYLIEGLGHCSMCHTSINPLGGPVNSAAFGGGLIPLQNWYAPSLTSSKEAGLGDWDSKDVADLLKTGVSQRGAVFGPMAEVVHNSLQYLSDADISAMTVYLKSIPQKKEAPESMQFETSEKFGTELLAQGQKIFTENCAKCHAENGLGKPPAYPPSTDGNPHPYGMPPFAQTLSDTEVAAVVTYIRMSWGNHGTPVSPQQVSNLRSAPLD